MKRPCTIETLEFRVMLSQFSIMLIPDSFCFVTLKKIGDNSKVQTAWSAGLNSPQQIKGPEQRTTLEIFNPEDSATYEITAEENEDVKFPKNMPAYGNSVLIAVTRKMLEIFPSDMTNADPLDYKGEVRFVGIDKTAWGIFWFRKYKKHLLSFQSKPKFFNCFVVKKEFSRMDSFAFFEEKQG